MSEQRSGDILGRILRERTDTSGPSSPEGQSRIDTAEVLAEVARAWPRSVDDRGRETLDMLCRKASVAKRVFRFYGRDWKKLPEVDTLGGPDLSLLAAVFLAHAQPTDGDPEDTGRRLKYLNAALETLDFAPDAPHAAALRGWAAETLESLTCTTGELCP